ncbi:MAG: GDSL-type esterase/lipase family protein, partial [Monoglobaceae bacterium]
VGMSEDYFRVGPGKLGEDWDFADYTPDMVVINLGTNDASATVMGTVPTDEEFTAKYVEFVNNIRTKYADAEIFLMGTFGLKYIDATQAAVTQLQTTDTKVHYIDTTGWISAADGDFCSDGVHPGIAGHKKIADKLKPILQEYLNEQ